ncbi:MAG: DUF4168 domain-containing protein [Longimicrobiales bacterium]
MAVAPALVYAQQPEITNEQLTSYATVYVEVARVREQFQAELAIPQNKTLEAQLQLRESLKQKVAQVITDGGMTEDSFRRMTWLISIDPPRREAFDRIVAEIMARKAAQDTTIHGKANGRRKPLWTPGGRPV